MLIFDNPSNLLKLTSGATAPDTPQLLDSPLRKVPICKCDVFPYLIFSISLCLPPLSLSSRCVFYSNTSAIVLETAITLSIILGVRIHRHLAAGWRSSRHGVPLSRLNRGNSQHDSGVKIPCCSCQEVSPSCCCFFLNSGFLKHSLAHLEWWPEFCIPSPCLIQSLGQQSVRSSSCLTAHLDHLSCVVLWHCGSSSLEATSVPQWSAVKLTASI